MCRRLPALIAALVAAPAFAQTPVDQLARPPAGAKVWTITRNAGAEHHGQVALWTDASGTHWSRLSLNFRSYVVEVDEQNRFAADGTLESMIIRGKTPQGDAAESYQAKSGSYTWTSPVDHGSGKTRPNLAYLALGGTRRPRFERAKVAGIKLMPRDLEILRAVKRHRLLRSTHLIALSDGSRQTTLRRLQLLFHHGYLDRPPMQLDWYAQGSEPLVYALGNRGAQALAAAGELKAGALRWENRDLSRHFLRHTLAVADVMVAFEIACRGREGVTLIQPEEVLAGAPAATRRLRLPFRWQVEVREGEKLHRLGVEPDRVFGLSFDGEPKHHRRAYFFLEADRGTMPVTRNGLVRSSFRRKLLGYRETWRQGASPIPPRHRKLPGAHGDDERGPDAAPSRRLPVAWERRPTLPFHGSRAAPQRPCARKRMAERRR